MQLLAGRHLHIARALRGSSDGFRTLARTLQSVGLFAEEFDPQNGRMLGNSRKPIVMSA